MTRPGRLDRRIELWRDEGTTQGDFGEALEDWTQIGSRWSEIQPGKGSEKFNEGSERANQSVVIVMRHDELTSTLDPKDRLRYLDREYDIASVSDRFTDHRYVEVLASHRSPEADRLP